MNYTSISPHQNTDPFYGTLDPTLVWALLTLSAFNFVCAVYFAFRK